MKRLFKKCVAFVLSASIIIPLGASSGSIRTVAEEKVPLTTFEDEFASPDNDAKPFMRWWIAPGRMNEEEIRKEMKNFKDGGYSGVELQCLELARNSVINDAAWNQTMKWILKAGIEYGVQVDMTIGQMWPIATPEITDVDDTRCEQRIFNNSAVFTASDGAMTYTAASYVYPSTSGQNAFSTSRASELIAITAAKVQDGNVYDSSTVIDVLADTGNVAFNESTGEISWTAPSTGDWRIFYFYRQSANHQVGYGITQYVIDHMSKEATEAVTDNWEAAMNSDAELKALYEENAGSIFGDSFELRSNLWTLDMLDEFETRRGYDLTPYLPVLTSTYTLSDVNSRVLDDVYTTMTELLAENHMQVFNDWADTHNMTLRYQAYSSAGSSVFELTAPALATDIVEAESYAMSGSQPDAYRQLSGVVNMRGDSLYTVEAAEIGQDSWRTGWTDVKRRDDSSSRNLGFMYYAQRFFAAGVNKAVFHGATYKADDWSGNYFPINATWPGYSAMAALSYGNEWDDKTPMWENIDIMTDALSRMQMVLQQGQGDVDIAMYRDLYGKGQVRSSITAVEQAGYTYDYMTEELLALDNAVVGTKDGKAVLAAEGPSYKALVIEPNNSGVVPEMSLEVAQKILNYAKNGLPVVIIGEAPSHVNSYPGSAGELNAADSQLVAYMNQLKALVNVISVADRSELVTALSSLGVSPDASPENPSNMYYQHRTTEKAELYYIYNDDSTAVSQKITLKGTGKPYLLDAWSGEVTPIAEYTAGNGTVTININIDTLDSMMVAIAQDGWSSKSVSNAVVSTNADSAVYAESENDIALRTAAGGDINVTLSDGKMLSLTADAAEPEINLDNWKMVMNQWTQGDTIHDTKVVKSPTYDLADTGLVPWYEINSQSLTRVAGVADYTTTFELEKGWTQGQGAYIDFTDISDVGRLFINDVEVPMNQMSVKTDIGEYLVKGTNKILVEVSSNMSNVVYGTTNANTYKFGILGAVVLTPYTQVSLVDKTKLDEAIEAADLSADDFRNDTWKKYEEALNAAKAVNDKANATQEEVNEALSNLVDATDNLIYTGDGLPYRDVAKNDWFYDYVKYVYDYKIMTGLNSVTFGPGANLGRAQLATMLYRLEGEPDVTYAKKFADVPDGQFYSKAVTWANQKGIVTGYENGKFGTSDYITRQDLSVMMYRYAQYKGYDVTKTSNIYSFPDYRNVSNYANQAIGWTIGMEIITGDGGNINPRGYANRAVAATIITRFMKEYK